MNKKVKNYIDGNWTDSKTEDYYKVINPVNLEVLGKTPLSRLEELDEAVQAAKKTFMKWRKTPPVERARYLFKLQNLIEDNFEDIARLITEENGKNIHSARGEVQRALENVEVAAGIPTLMQGYNSEDIARGIDEKAIVQPLGVFGCITPFNFPAMIPFWFAPYAIATGNTYIIKPSEKTPFTAMKLIELMAEAGIPDGVINLVNGSEEIAKNLIAHPDIEGISFVGSTKVGKKVYENAAKHGKRAQVQGGACNFIMVMPDAKIDQSKSNILSSFFACAGQRCLAGQNLIAVGDEAYDKLKNAIKDEIPNMQVGNGLNEDVDMGPIIDENSKNKILNMISKAEENGAKVIIDGRDINVDDYPEGLFIGPTVLEINNTDLEIVHEEIFGPVMNLIKVENFDEGLKLINSNRYGNAANIYTQSGKWAREFAYNVRGGNVGINIGVPAPVPHFPFSGMKDSFFGDLHAQGKDVINFFTEKKVVIERW